MRRREFLGILGGAAVTDAWPLATYAQQPAIPTIGLVSPQSQEDSASRIAAFRRGLAEHGFVEGRNVAIEYRWGDRQIDRLPGLISDLVGRRVSVIAAFSTDAALAAKAFNSTTPIVFLTGTDPVKIGLVGSLNRPGGSFTGISFLADLLVAKQFELLHEMLPKAPTLGIIVNSNNSNTQGHIRDVQAAADALGHKLAIVKAGAINDIEPAFTSLLGQGAAGLVIPVDPFFTTRSRQFIALAARHALPTIYALRQIAVAGGLASYGTSLADAQRLVGLYVGRVLKGEKPAELPIQQSVKVELVVNLKTAKTLGLTVPPMLLARADEVIE